MQNEKGFDPHNREAHFETILAKFKKEKRINEKLILKFLSEWRFEGGKGKGTSTGRLERYLQCLTKFDSIVKKPFNSCKKKDLLNFFVVIDKEYSSAHTQRDFRIAIKTFFKWNKKSELVSWFSTAIKANKRLLPEDVLTESEIFKIIGAATTTRSKALVAILFDSGARASEILTLKIKNVSFDSYGATISVQGKTGSRRIRLVPSVPYLTRWINEHQRKENPDAYLWELNERPLSYQRARLLIKKYAIRAGIVKRVYLHGFRHARATELASLVPEAILKAQFGWTQDSKMASTYIHLSGVQTDNAILKANGVIVPEDKQKSILLPKTCQYCKTANPSSAVYCEECSRPLSLEAILKAEEKQQEKLIELIDAIISRKEAIKTK